MSEITTIGLDLAKHVFQVHGIDAQGTTVLRKRLRRGQVLAFFRTRLQMTRCSEDTIDIASGHLAIDRYLAESYEQVRGMSSRFAAAICGHLIRRQSELAIVGDLVEIGTFEGRFFIAMALGLAGGEKAVGIDRFDWPDSSIESRILANCTTHGIARDR